ncbi:proline-, glutamic acid- and leucine-rich protein 1 isoform X1 [Fagus crenata]
MAAFNHFKNMYDVAMKPRLLRTLIKERVPDETHPFENPAELSTVVSMIKTHGLLSESFGESTDQKLIENWKSAVDSWFERLLLLVSNNMPDKRWAGICLLGVTCQECSSDRFLASYSLWFNRLLPYIQSPGDSQFVKVASCASVSDIFTRLGGFPNLKKDGTSHAGKLIQPVLRLLNDCSEAIWEGAVQLLITIITYFPSSIHRHYDSAEAAVASKLLSGKCGVDLLKKLADCLALLPKSRGDEDSWSLMIQKIILLLNSLLNDAFQGLEEEAKCSEVVRLLVPPGKDPPPPLGGQILSGEASDSSTRRSERSLMSSVSTQTTLMLCCCTMLTSSYPVQVNVPVRSLLVLVERVLKVDGSLPHALLPFMTSMQQELICSELPVLHSYSLELLIAIIKGTRSQLLPYTASIVRLITAYFKRCALPELRIKVYSITRILLISMGVGMAVCLAQEVVNNAFVDLNVIGNESVGTSANANLKASSEALLQSNHRKRRHGTSTGYLEEQVDQGGLQVKAPKNNSISPISVRIAALEALEALLTVGGALRSESWRSNVDHLLITTAANSLKGGSSSEEKNIFQPNEPTAAWVDFQLTALRALLASLLSSVHVRPPYLAQGLELFRKGKQETGSKLAEFCAHALLALEVLIHPRALPLFSPASCNSFEGVNPKFSESIYSGGLKHGGPFTSGIQGIRGNIPDLDHDDLGDEMGQDPVAANVNVRMGGNEDEIMVETDQFHESIAQIQEPGSSRGATDPESIDVSLGTQISSGIVSGSGASDHAGNVFASGQDVLVAKGDEFATTGINTSDTTSISEKITGDALELDGDYPFPEIFDVDPDSEDE